MHDEARLLPAVLDAAGIGRAVLFGHSDGGSIALICAGEHPERVDLLVLQAPHVFAEDLSVQAIRDITADFARTDLRERLARHHRDPDLVFHGWSDVWLDPAFREWNLEAFLPRVTCPVLLLQGDRDEYGTLRQIDVIERHVAAPVERHILADCGHWPHRERRDQTLAAVAAFIARHAPAPGRASHSTAE